MSHCARRRSLLRIGMVCSELALVDWHSRFLIWGIYRQVIAFGSNKPYDPPHGGEAQSAPLPSGCAGAVDGWRGAPGSGSQSKNDPCRIVASLSGVKDPPLCGQLTDHPVCSNNEAWFGQRRRLKHRTSKRPKPSVTTNGLSRFHSRATWIKGPRSVAVLKDQVMAEMWIGFPLRPARRIRETHQARWTMVCLQKSSNRPAC